MLSLCCIASRGIATCFRWGFCHFALGKNKHHIQRYATFRCVRVCHTFWSDIRTLNKAHHVVSGGQLVALCYYCRKLTPILSLADHQPWRVSICVSPPHNGPRSADQPQQCHAREGWDAGSFWRIQKRLKWCAKIAEVGENMIKTIKILLFRQSGLSFGDWLIFVAKSSFWKLPYPDPGWLPQCCWDYDADKI